MKDPRDGKIYKTVKIGDQEWMAENMNYDIKYSYCYEDSPENCEKYGRLYTRAAANYVCPEGWHLPTEEEFETLVANVGKEKTAGIYLKSTTGWDEYDGIIGGMDLFGFNVLPAGNRDTSGDFGDAGKDAYFWGATEDGELIAYYLSLYYNRESARLGYYDRDDATSVRCLRD